MKKKMSVLAILSVAVLLGFTACGGDNGGGGPVGPLGVPESTITVQNAPSGHISLVVSTVNTAPVTSQQLQSAIQSAAGAGSGNPSARIFWTHGGIQTGQRLVIVTVAVGAGQQRFGLANIAGNGNATINWNNMTPVEAIL